MVFYIILFQFLWGNTVGHTFSTADIWIGMMLVNMNTRLPTHDLNKSQIKSPCKTHPHKIKCSCHVNQFVIHWFRFFTLSFVKCCIHCVPAQNEFQYLRQCSISNCAVFTLCILHNFCCFRTFEHVQHYWCLPLCNLCILCILSKGDQLRVEVKHATCYATSHGG